nr:competence protein CoiA family protein [Nocardioides malaquae]
MARQVREEAKRDWRCPVPGCTVEITTVASDSRRDHFRHNQPAPHPSDGESEAHLSAKAMLAEWASQRVPAGGSVREEQTVKDPATSIHRIADVMVTWPDQRLTAFEVEYKPFTPDAWRTKQADYDTKHVACAWLLGHTRIKPVVEPDSDMSLLGPVKVRVPELARAFIDSGRHVLIVNPQTRQVGTLAADPEFTYRVRQFASEAYLRVDDLSVCRLDPVLGLVTPGMWAIDEAARLREAAARVAEEEALRRRQGLLARLDQTRDPQGNRTYRRTLEEIDADNLKRWTASPWKARAHEVWGIGLPAFIADRGERPRGVHAFPAHWHTVLFITQVHGRPAGHTFTVKDIYAAFTQNHIRTTYDNRRLFRSVIEFLERLQHERHITIHSDNANGWVQHLTVVDREALLRAEAEERARRDRERQGLLQQQAEQHRLRQEDERRRDEESRREREARQKHHLALTKRWVASEAHRATLLIYNTIPVHIRWEGGLYRRSIDADPTQWHAEIFLRCIYDKPAGTVVTVADALTALTVADINLVSPPEATRAVEDYLYNLHQRGLLVRVDDQTFETPPAAHEVLPVEDPQEGLW